MLCLLQGNLRHFIDYVKTCNLEKVNKMTNKGLDPNFHDSSTGGRESLQTDKQTNKIQINWTKTQIYKAFWWNITTWIVVFERKGKGRNASCNVWMNLQCKETTNHFGKVILTLLKVFSHLFLKFAQSFACYFRNMLYVLAKPQARIWKSLIFVFSNFINK